MLPSVGTGAWSDRRSIRRCMGWLVGLLFARRRLVRHHTPGKPSLAEITHRANPVSNSISATTCKAMLHCRHRIHGICTDPHRAYDRVSARGAISIQHGICFPRDLFVPLAHLYEPSIHRMQPQADIGRLSIGACFAFRRCLDGISVRPPQFRQVRPRS